MSVHFEAMDEDILEGVSFMLGRPKCLETTEG